MIDGYESIYDGECCRILGSDAVRSHWVEYSAQRAGKKSVMKVGMILRKLADFGPQLLRNKEQFRHEGAFSYGRGQVAVYAVKDFQLRVYGGFVHVEGKSTFLCVESVAKKSDKASKDLLARVGRALGEQK